MKTLARLTLISWVISILLAGGAAQAASPAKTEEAGSWVVIHELPVDFAVTVAGFVDEDHGITAGYGGEKHYTTDGGETWPKAANNSWCRFGLSLVDEDLAWTAGNGGMVRVSTDGGQTWEAVSSLPDPGVSPYISFVDDQVGWVANRSTLWATSDGGQTWNEVTPPEGVENVIAAVALRAADEGYLLDFTGTLYVTTDGGQTWTALSLGLDEDLRLDISSEPAMRFLDADQGLIVLRLKSSDVIALRTADGGQTWEQETIPFEIGELPPGIPSTAFVLSPDGTLLTIAVRNTSVIVVQYQES